MSAIRFVDALLADPSPDEWAHPGTDADREALDAYSAVVTSVAERVIASVASLRVTRRVPGGYQAQGSGPSSGPARPTWSRCPWGTPTGSGSASSSWPWATPWASPAR